MTGGEVGRARVLIVDDDPDTRAMSAEALRDRYDVVCAATSAEALGRVRERVPDAIVVDVMLGVRVGGSSSGRCRGILDARPRRSSS